jgi:KaiC/GvpD/RAD55 family RecA-like ATPase
MSDFQFLSIDDLLAAAAKSKRLWPVAGLIPYEGVTLVYGQFANDVAIPMARAIATGEPWNGKPTFREGGKVCLFTQCDAHTAAAELGKADHIMLAAKQTIWGDERLKNGDVVKFEERAVGTINSATDAGAEIVIMEYPPMRNMLDVQRLVKGWSKAAVETGVPVVLCVPTPMISTVINDWCAASIHVSRIFVPGRWGARCTWITGQRDAADNYAIYTDSHGVVIPDNTIAEHTRDKCEVLALASLRWIADAQTKVLQTLEDIDQAPDPRWLVHATLPETAITFVYGAPKTGKSFFALSLAMHIAADKTWFGKAVTQGPVIYIAAEGQAGLKKRIAAARKAYGIPDKIPLFVKPAAVKLTDREAVLQFIRDVSEAVGMPAMVVVDTFSRSVTGSDENSAKEMTVAIEEAEAIKRAFGCNVCVVHHSGKDAGRGMRGSNSLPGASDCTIRLERTPLADRKTGKPDVITVMCEHMKDAPEFEDMFFDMVTSGVAPVLHWRDDAPKAAKDAGPKLTSKQKAAEDIVLAAFREADASEIPMAAVMLRVVACAEVTTAARMTDRRNNARDSILKAGERGGKFFISEDDGAERLTLFNPEGGGQDKDDTIPD